MKVLGKLILFLLWVDLIHPSFFNGPLSNSLSKPISPWACGCLLSVCTHSYHGLMQGNLLAGETSSGFFSSWHDNVWCFCFPSLLAYTEQYLEYDPFLVPPDPSNPWISDDTTFWELEARYTILFLLWK